MIKLLASVFRIIIYALAYRGLITIFQIENDFGGFLFGTGVLLMLVLFIQFSYEEGRA